MLYVLRGPFAVPALPHLQLRAARHIHADANANLIKYKAYRNQFSYAHLLFVEILARIDTIAPFAAITRGIEDDIGAENIDHIGHLWTRLEGDIWEMEQKPVVELNDSVGADNAASTSRAEEKQRDGLPQPPRRLQ